MAEWHKLGLTKEGKPLRLPEPAGLPLPAAPAPATMEANQSGALPVARRGKLPEGGPAPSVRPSGKLAPAVAALEPARLSAGAATEQAAGLPVAPGRTPQAEPLPTAAPIRPDAGQAGQADLLGVLGSMLSELRSLGRQSRAAPEFTPPPGPPNKYPPLAGGYAPPDLDADQGYPLSSPSVNASTTAGSRGAGGYGFGSAHAATPPLVTRGRFRGRSPAADKNFLEPGRTKSAAKGAIE